MARTDLNVPRCECSHLWWWHKFNKTCALCPNWPELSLDGVSCYKPNFYKEKENCIGFKWRKQK